MALYEYKAFDGQGKRVGGTITAEGPAAARRRIAAMQRFPEHVREVRPSSGSSGARRWPMPHWAMRRIDAAETATALRHMATLVASGMPLPACLGALSEQPGRGAWQRVCTQMRERILEGESLSGAMAEHPHVFGDIHVHMVRAGEAGGALATVLQRLAEFTESRARLKKKMETALTYPMFLMMVGGVILVFMMRFVMPNVVAIFQGMEQVLPWSTRALLWMTGAVRTSWWVAPAAVFAFAPIFLAWKKSASGRSIWDGIRLRVPCFGKLHRQAVRARFFRTLSTLLRSGIPLVPALEIAGSAAGNRIAAVHIERIRQRVGEGESFAAAMQTGSLFPALAVQLVRTGEQSGELDDMAARAADVFEEDFHDAVNAAMALAEPLIILFMGGVVGFIVMAVLLPMFDLTGAVR